MEKKIYLGEPFNTEKKIQDFETRLNIGIKDAQTLPFGENSEEVTVKKTSLDKKIEELIIKEIALWRNIDGMEDVVRITVEDYLVELFDNVNESIDDMIEEAKLEESE